MPDCNAPLSGQRQPQTIRATALQNSEGREIERHSPDLREETIDLAAMEHSDKDDRVSFDSEPYPVIP